LAGRLFLSIAFVGRFAAIRFPDHSHGSGMLPSQFKDAITSKIEPNYFYFDPKLRTGRCKDRLTINQAIVSGQKTAYRWLRYYLRSNHFDEYR
jgi:hypothetical protein